MFKDYRPCSRERSLILSAVIAWSFYRVSNPLYLIYSRRLETTEPCAWHQLLSLALELLENSRPLKENHSPTCLQR